MVAYRTRPPCHFHARATHAERNSTSHRKHPALPRLAPGGHPADAREHHRQRRAARGPHHLREHRAGGARLALLPRHRRAAARARRRRNTGGAVRQAGGGVPELHDEPPGGARHLQPGAALGDPRGVREAACRRSHDTRPVHRGLVGLHRQPGHHAGHLRSVRRLRAAALRRLAHRARGAERRAGRHGLGPASRNHHERRGGARRGDRPLADRAPPGERPHRRVLRRPRHRVASLPGRGGGGRSAGLRAAGECRRRVRTLRLGARTPRLRHRPDFCP